MFRCKHPPVMRAPDWAKLSLLLAAAPVELLQMCAMTASQVRVVARCSQAAKADPNRRFNSRLTPVQHCRFAVNRVCLTAEPKLKLSIQT